MLAKKSAIPCNDIIACLMHQKTKTGLTVQTLLPPPQLSFFSALSSNPK